MEHVSNPLKGAFWDYPRLTQEATLRIEIAAARESADINLLDWYLRRLIEYGRIRDTLRFFTMTEIDSAISRLRLSEYATSRWNRAIKFLHDS